MNRRKTALFIILLHSFAAIGVLSALEIGSVPFSTPLPIPPLLEDENPESAAFEATLAAGKGKISFFANASTSTYGYNGDFLGPTIRVRKGQKVELQIQNNLSETTTLHWHGLHVPAEMDGGPHQKIEPGSTWKPEFTILQEAATLWYHPHALGKTGKHVYMGLAGLFIIDDAHSDTLNLPNSYGVDDIPLILQDRRFFEDGSFAYVQSTADVMHGVIGNVMLVNGTVQPVLETDRDLLRFRILNGSNASLYRISVRGPAGEKPVTSIATDGGYLEKPVSIDRLVLSPGERNEVLVDIHDLNRGEEMYVEVEEFNGRQFQALKIVKTGSRGKIVKIPAALNTIAPLDVNSADKVRKFFLETRGMGRFTINGKQMNMARIDETVRLGSTEIWEISNRGMGMMNLPHSFHVHDVQFQVLTRDGEQPPPHERGWKDTVLVWPGETVRIISRFEDFTGIYMYHCHMLEHEDAGMMGQFRVE